ncbi:cation diffusion facilitator CzcD-associated flavoprotein CzcO [Novosphingobium chloroacetimidivorans]|uniref:Cation diffusion facilitator CzcD-associated flavoprotein CzcO n=1 Tax=Novosphingobium chloroacetimidivorans TaxID=1428314 RepID=A0A7W7NZ25_9SPHN|nr:NAD(P)/FAD-dependent oxidoreductase [Novosphingobium chloroacetimidivorans]MBB4860767.1 cation diffusion facilitator CzcD-associated flavoprotein CzcO [Novosphingobium chloroacetimidivorans]
MGRQDQGELRFSPEELRRKYAAEREKRLRPDGIAQYRDFAGIFSEDDPYTPRVERLPRHETIDVVVIGGGFGGLLTAAELRKAGIGDFRIVEKAGDFGGTWYWNRYPGVRCDVESYIYLPLLEEMGYEPRERYATGAEILAYCQQIGRRYALYETALFQTAVTEVRWSEKNRRWSVLTDRGDVLDARFVVVAGGVLHKPKLPGIPGIETFAGESFHTSRWDYAVTGGDAGGGLDKLAGKRVGIIGTGATAVQAIPLLAQGAGHLHVFQRTPSGVGERGNATTDRQWYAALAPGWQRERMANFTSITAGQVPDRILVEDGWTDVFLPLVDAAASDPANAAEQRELADMRNMERIRARVDALVDDPVTAEALKPYYHQMCKRPCFHDEYLATFNRPNVTLVDTDGVGVERITPKGVVVGGTEYELDCLIHASGFEVATIQTRRLGFDMIGRAGQSLEASLERGAETLFGLHRLGFPNLFLFSTTQAGASINFVHVLVELAEHAAYVIRKAREQGATTVEPSREATEGWLRIVLSRLQGFGEFQRQCTPGYFNNEGNLGGGVLRNVGFVGDANEYFAMLHEWRAAERMEGLVLTIDAQQEMTR